MGLMMSDVRLIVGWVDGMDCRSTTERNRGSRANSHGHEQSRGRIEYEGNPRKKGSLELGWPDPESSEHTTVSRAAPASASGGAAAPCGVRAGPGTPPRRAGGSSAVPFDSRVASSVVSGAALGHCGWGCVQ